MSTATATVPNTSGRHGRGTWGNGSVNPWWTQHREATLNWLALGMLLAAWNATDGDMTPAVRRPEALRGYTYVSVRGAANSFEQGRAGVPN